MSDALLLVAVPVAVCAVFAVGVAVGVWLTTKALSDVLGNPYVGIDVKHPDDRIELQD